MINPKRTLQLIRGGLIDSQNTWNGYLKTAEDWKETAFLLTGPLIVVSAVAAYCIGFLGKSSSLFSLFRPTIASTIGTIVSTTIGAIVVAFVVSALAGAFGGKKSFALALAATSLAFIPSYLGQAAMWLPWIGGLLSLALFIYALVLLWRVIPVYLSVPDGKRAIHYILSLIVSVVVMAIFSATIGRFFLPGMTESTVGTLSDTRQTSPTFSEGAFGGLARQGQLIEAAQGDEYEPPTNGRIREKQVEEFIRIMVRTDELRKLKLDQYKAIAEKAEKDQDISLNDLGQILSSVTDAAGLQTAEIEVVKSAGGNWAEHQWIKNSLRTAMIQKDSTKAVEHNYELFKRYEDQLANYL